MYYGDFKIKTLNCIFPVKNAYQLKSLNLASFNYGVEYSLSQTTIRTDPCFCTALVPFGYLGYRTKTSKIYFVLLSTESSKQGYKYKYLCKQLEAIRKFFGVFLFVFISQGELTWQ